MSTSPARALLPPLLAILALLAAAPARADVFLVAEFAMLPGEEQNSYAFTAEIPQAADNASAVTWPDACTEVAADRQSVGARSHYAFEIECERPLGAGDVVQTPWIVDGARLTTSIMGAKVTRNLAAGERGVAVPVGGGPADERLLHEVALDYLWQGMLHIWIGWDHLAFVLCLCLIARRRQLLGLVTAFTVGHSASLALAFFEVVAVPMPPVEAVIALSIAFMARETLRARDPTAVDPDLRRHLVVVSSFGLLHGLGFASALTELGVQPAERVPGLIFFNLGVEAGQLAFVGVVTGVLALARAAAALQPVRRAAAYGAGVLGCFWMVERVAGFPWA